MGIQRHVVSNALLLYMLLMMGLDIIYTSLSDIEVYLLQ